MEPILWQHAERWPWAVVAAVVGGWLLWQGYRSGRSGLNDWRRNVAVGCKALFFGLVACVICDPVRVREEARRGANELVLAVEGAQRLALNLKPGSQSAAEGVRAAWSAEADWVGDLTEQYRVRRIELGDRMTRVADGSALNFASAQPSVVGAVKSLRQSGLARRTAAVVVFTDGNAADMERVAELAAEGAPVFPVLAVEGEVGRDLAIERVAVAQTPFEDTAVTAETVVRALGCAGEEIVVTLLDGDGKRLTEEKLTVRTADEARVVRLQMPGLKPGLTPVQVVVTAVGLREAVTAGDWKATVNEVTAENNAWQVMVDRGQGPYRVLYVAGRPNWEYKFLRRALRADDEVQLPALVRIAKREPKFEWRGREGETSNPLFRGFGAAAEEAQRYDQPVLIRLETRDAAELAEGFPKRAEDLMADYRAVIVDDLEAEFFNAEQMRLVERFVTERGGTLILLGGQESYRTGGYANTLIGQMLPVYLDAPRAVAPMKDARLDLTREGLLEPWMRLRMEDDAERIRLGGVPGFYSVNQTFSIKPGAALLATVKGAEGVSVPAVVAQRLGEGRVISVLIADLWRWGMNDPDGRTDLEKWWRQVLRWSVVDAPEQVEVTIVKAPVGTGRELKVRVRDDAFDPMDDAEVVVRVKGRSGAEDERLFAAPSMEERGTFEASYSSVSEGLREVEVVVQRTVDDKPAAVGSVRTGWADNPLAESLARLKPNREALERLAAATGGAVFGMGELEALAEKLRNLDAPVMDRRVEPLWHVPAVFLGLLALLLAEWWLRRKGGTL